MFSTVGVEAFGSVAEIIDNDADTASARTVSAITHNDVIGGFVRIPFGNLSGQRFVIIGLTIPRWIAGWLKLMRWPKTAATS